jgi:diaminohydroxyphosphoribosylaminopyrimidine deaminase/5-amino-6-(5-phosphoribosylamino)uracil reductase
MKAALALAERGLGTVWPNPAVGCVLVRAGRVVGRGWTQPGGRPHAESEALRRAGDAATGATAYVTLEPCAHHGKTPPCAGALVKAGIARLVAAMADPDARVSGRGFEQLETAGIELSVGLGGAEAAHLNAGFVRRVESGRPLVTLKLATSLDGRIATRSGESQWITGDLSRARGHLLRARHDAILVGSATALADDPGLTCRLPGLAQCSPVRIVMDGRLRLPLDHQLVADAGDVPTWIVTLAGAGETQRQAYMAAGVEMIEVAPDGDGHPDALGALQALGERGITRLLVEGGAHISAAFLGARLVDRLVCFRSTRMIGGDGAPAVQSLALDRLAEAPAFVRRALGELDGDMFESFDADI